MQKLLAMLSISIAASMSGVCATPYVKSASGGWFPTTGGAGTVSITPAAAGNMIVVSAFAFTQATTLTISDTQSNTWTPVQPLTTAVGGSEYQSWYALVNSTAGTTITVRYASGANFSLEVKADEFTGVTGLDKHAGASMPGTTNPISVGPLSPSSNGELLWAVGNSGSITGIGSGYTSGGNFDITTSEYQVLASTSGAGGSYNATFATNSNGSNAALMFATFTMAGSGGGSTPPPSGGGTVTYPLSIANGGNGTSTPGITGGTGISVAGTWPNYQITNTAPGGSSTGSSVFVGPDKDAKGDFHCAGDGVTDDTACLQAAITATQSDNGSLYLPPGRYKISSTLTINSAIAIGGHQGTVCKSSSPWCGSEIYYTGTSRAIQVNGFVTRIWFHDLTISSSTGKGNVEAGVYLNQAEETGFDRVNIGDYGGTGTEKLGFTAAIKTNHFAISWIRDCNFEDDTYALDGEDGFMASVLIQNNNYYRVLAAVRVAGGSSNINIKNNWFESVRYIIDIDTAAHLGGGVISENHVNDDSGNDASLTGAHLIEISNSGASMGAFVISANSVNLSGGSSFIDNAGSMDHIVLIGNAFFGSPSTVFSGGGSATVGTLANSMPATLGNATRLTQ